MRHRWTELMKTDVEIMGFDDMQDPVVLHTSDPQAGINCELCFTPLTQANAQADDCPGHHAKVSPT